MKKNNKKLMTLLLAGVLCGTVAGVANIEGKVTASADAGEYTLTQIFAADNGAELKDDTATQFVFSGDTSAVRYKNDLAFAWYEGKGDAKYLNFEFAFADFNFSQYTFAVESKSAWSTEYEKVTNTIHFVNNEGVISAYVLNDGEEFKAEGEDKTEVHALTVASEETVKVSLSKQVDEFGNEVDGAFTVTVKDTVIGAFENVGSNWSEYEYDTEYKDRMFPLVIGAKVEEEKQSTLKFESLNGQSFALTNGKVVDNAAPVLVVDDELNGFELGDSFSLNYSKIDVLETELPTETKEYYQFNPTDAKPGYGQKISGTGSSLYFMDTVYKKGDKDTTVYREYGSEFVSILITLSDSKHNTDETKKVYDLSWYANADAVATHEQGEGEEKVATDFIKIYVSETGATYKLFEVKDGANKKVSNYDAQVNAYQKRLSEAATGKFIDEDVNFPSMEWLFDDDNGYRNLKFTICYRTPSSTSAKSTSGISYNKLKLTVTEEGLYEFKVFAIDLAGNKMQCYNEEGKLVDVDTTTVWEIEEIPSFTFEIQNQGIKVKELSSSSSRKVSKSLDDKYTLSDLTVVGAKSKASEYKLYKLANLSDYAIYTKVTFADLKAAADELIKNADKTKEIDYAAIYLQAYASKTGLEISNFQEIAPMNKLIDKTDKEWDTTDNKYEFDEKTGSFVAAEEGGYLILANYWNTELPTQRAVGYKIITVGSEGDTVEGDDEWFENNLVSIILFSVAGLLLIILIILFFIKPSNETLADVDKKVKKEKKAKKSK